ASGRRPRRASSRRSAGSRRPSPSPPAPACCSPRHWTRPVPGLRTPPGGPAPALPGDLRRGVEMVDRVDVVVASTTPAAARMHALAMPGVLSVSESGPAAYRAVLDSGLPLDVRVTLPDQHAATLLHATGSAAHLTHLARLAEGRGLHLARAGLSRAADGRPLAARDEEDLYGYLRLPFLVRALRRGER